MTVRISKEMRVVLEIEAQRMGCSISLVARTWLEQRQFLQKLIDSGLATLNKDAA
jgi:hypothetical protein